MTAYRLRGPAKTTVCTSCGGANRTHGVLCSFCQYEADTKALGVRHCALCGSSISRSRMLISPYCSIECSNKVAEIRSSVGAAIRKAVKSGVIQKLDGSVQCVDCGNPARHYDHRDYTKPLDVSPVCRSCNFKRGPAHTFPTPCEQEAA